MVKGGGNLSAKKRGGRVPKQLTTPQGLGLSPGVQGRNVGSDVQGFFGQSLNLILERHGAT